MTGLPTHLKKFIENSTWIYAKTYAKTWPHEYIVQEKVDNALFLEFAAYIDKNGYEEYFYDKKQVYYDYDGNTYWHMGDIINRCLEADTYQRRKIDGRLPAEEKE